MTKQYTNQDDLIRDAKQSLQQHGFNNDVQRMKDNFDKSMAEYNQYNKGEEGIDYMVMPDKWEDPRYPSEKLLVKQIKRELNILKMQDPEKAKEYQKLILEKNQVDRDYSMQLDLSEVKTYPGSIKGPLPEDDPEHYSRWFVENQPKSLVSGTNANYDFSDLGVKRKYV